MGSNVEWFYTRSQSQLYPSRFWLGGEGKGWREATKILGMHAESGSYVNFNMRGKQSCLIAVSAVTCCRCSSQVPEVLFVFRNFVFCFAVWTVWKGRWHNRTDCVQTVPSVARHARDVRPSDVYYQSPGSWGSLFFIVTTVARCCFFFFFL